jgi:hypothetical protein
VTVRTSVPSPLSPRQATSPSSGDVPEAPPPPRRRLRRPAAADVLALGVYLVVALWVTARLWTGSGRRSFTDYPFDQAFFEWVFAHGARVLSHGENPFFTTRLNAPDGVNMVANNSQLGLTLPLAPVTLLFGAHVSVTVATIGSLAGTAFGWYLLLSRRIVGSRFAAFLGGAVCGFAWGVLSHAGGQLNVITTFLVPFIVWQVLRLREPGRAVRGGLILAALVVYQVFIAEEPLFIAAITLGIFVLVYAALYRSEARRVARRFAAGLGVCAAAAGLALAYPLYFQFFGPQHYRGIIEWATGYGASFESFTGRRWPGLEQVVYAQDALTLPLTALTLVIGAVLWRRAPVRVLVLTSVILGVLALGRLPVRELPLFDSLVPARLQLACLVIAGILLAIGWDEVSRRPRPRCRFARLVRPVGYAALLGSLVPLVPNQLGAAPVTPPPPFISDGTWRRYVPPDRTLVPVPVPKMSHVDGMRWSASTNLDVAIPGGYFFSPDGSTDKRASYGPPDRPTTALLLRVAESGDVPEITPEMRGDTWADLRYWRAAAVVLAPHPREDALRRILDDLLGPGERVGGVWVWRVR